MASTMPVVGDLGVAGEAPHCGHFVQRKKRFCRMFVPPGKKFCAEHSIDTNDTTKLNSSGLPQLDARIPCPLDPKHNCQASKLQKHIKVRRSSSTYVLSSFCRFAMSFFCLTLAGVPSQQQTYERGILCVICQHSQTRMEWPRSPIPA